MTKEGQLFFAQKDGLSGDGKMGNDGLGKECRLEKMLAKKVLPPFLDSGFDSPVELTGSLFVRLSNCLFVRQSPPPTEPSSQARGPARPEDQPARPETQSASHAWTQPARLEAQSARPVAQPVRPEAHPARLKP